MLTNEITISNPDGSFLRGETLTIGDGHHKSLKDWHRTHDECHHRPEYYTKTPTGGVFNYKLSDGCTKRDVVTITEGA